MLPDASPETTLNDGEGSNIGQTSIGQTSSSDNVSDLKGTVIPVPDDLSILGNQAESKVPTLALPLTDSENDNAQQLNQNINSEPKLSNAASLNKLLLTALILFVASVLQGAAGMYFAIIMMPLLLLNGFSLAQASMFSAITGLAISSFSLFKEKDFVKWSAVWPTMYLRVAAMAVGVFLLAVLNMFSTNVVIQIVGIVLLLSLVLYVLLRARANPTTPPQSNWFSPQFMNSQWFTLGLSSLSRGALGFGNPLVSLWTKTQTWSHEEQKAFKTAALWTMLPIQIIFLFGTFGKALFQVSSQALLFIPIALLAIFIGLWCSKNWFDSEAAQNRLHNLILVILLLIAVLALSAPYFNLISA